MTARRHVRGEFARIKAWGRPATQVMARRSFEPILDLRVPVSDGPCAWPAADFGSLRESLTAGAGRPPYTGGSGSSSTRRSGPLLHFGVLEVEPAPVPVNINHLHGPCSSPETWAKP